MPLTRRITPDGRPCTFFAPWTDWLLARKTQRLLYLCLTNGAPKDESTSFWAFALARYEDMSSLRV